MADKCGGTANGLQHSLSAGSDQARRAAAKRLIERYYYQLMKGCGKTDCVNEHCASSRRVWGLTPNQAAAQALDLFARKAKLCDLPDSHDDKDRPGTSKSDDVAPTNSKVKDVFWMPPTFDSPLASGPEKAVSAKPTRLHEDDFKALIHSCRETGNYSKLVHTLGHVFSNPELLGQSFLGYKLLGKTAGPDTTPGQLSKEQMRSMEVDMDKDKDCQDTAIMEVQNNEDFGEQVTVDVAAVRRCFEALGALESAHYESPLVHALILLSETLELDLKFGKNRPEVHLVNVFAIAFELPWLGVGEYFENVLPALCRACALLPLAKQAALVRFWALEAAQLNLRHWVQTLQQLISFRVLSGDFGRDYAVNDDDTITACVKVMRIFYCVNIFACTERESDLRSSVMTAPSSSASVAASAASVSSMETDEAKDWFEQSRQRLFADGIDAMPRAGESTSASSSKQIRGRKEDPLVAELGINVLDCRQPLVPFADFYNEPLSDVVEMDRDFAYFAAASESPTPPASSGAAKISFMNFAFILTPAAKALGLYYDNRIRMYSERRMSLFHSVVHGQPSNPYLKLKVRRDHVIDDALIGLEMVAMENPSDLKKQLVVEFEGEQGIDEGGLSKEFFQLVIDQIFNPDFAMFSHNGDTHQFWFNPTSFESDGQFTLVGIMLGLAIYNTVILDVHFPMVVYRKLLGRKGTFQDLNELDPTLAKGLRNLLDHEDDDVEDTFMQTFRISYKDVFGVVYHHDLKVGGSEIAVTRANRQEFVDLYADFLLNESIGRQFAAFRRGFTMVTDESPLAMLFRPEEVELLVCGSSQFDFEELQNATEYDGGFTAQSDTIQLFWSVVHELSVEDKRRLLQFTTGSDRVPVGGLGRLKLIIARHGTDSDRLPMAHTCYNVLLLPDYCDKDKLKERLMKAIDYSKGFGML